MKILFTSVGRRVELIQAFRHAAEQLKERVVIIGEDLMATAPALYFCDDRINDLPKIREHRYLSELLFKCKERKIDCLIPTIDTNLSLLAENKKKFEQIGTKVMIGPFDKVKMCRDKKLTAEYFVSLGLCVPSSVDKVEDYKGGFPAFIKPKDGSSSIDAYRVSTLEDLKRYAESIDGYVIQPFIKGREFSVDIFCDYDGNPIFITPRERLAVRAGEVLKTKIIQDNAIISEMMVLVKDFRPSGQITVQLIRDENFGKDYYIEINPRFGGGAPLAIKAGADSAKAIIRMLRGEKLEYQEKAAKDGEIYSRFDQSIKIEK